YHRTSQGRGFVAQLGIPGKVLALVEEAVGKRPPAVRQAHGPEQSRRAALPLSPALLNSRYARRRSRFNRASHCGVLLCTPHSSGFVRASLGLPTLRAGPRFRKPCIWRFSISLSEAGFPTVLPGLLLNN
ncbi:MAG: hypothetical protein PVH99_19955, partial [Desulfobacteraceae bacterium]